MRFSIIGSGTWGTALAQILDDNKHDVLIYGIDKNQIDDININHQNSFYFGKDITLAKSIRATTDLSEAISFSDMFVLVVPTVAMRSVLEQIKELLNKKSTFIIASKGFDPLKGERMSTLVREVIPSSLRNEIVTIAGPGHAEEAILRDLTCVSAISKDEKLAIEIAKLFSNQYFRVYYSSDEVGSEIGVAMKNSIAIASGILEGLGLGDNARAALCTRGLAEITRFGVLNGANMNTYLGLTGLGDLVVTCYSKHSRNFMAGYEIGKANSAVEFLKNNKKTVEGIRTTEVIYKKANELNVELPIISILYSILFLGKKPSEEILKLMSRPLTTEFHD